MWWPTQTSQSVGLPAFKLNIEFLSCEKSLHVLHITVQTTVSSCLICVFVLVRVGLEAFIIHVMLYCKRLIFADCVNLFCSSEHRTWKVLWEDRNCLNVPSNVKWRIFDMHLFLSFCVFTSLCFCFSFILESTKKLKQCVQAEKSL